MLSGALSLCHQLNGSQGPQPTQKMSTTTAAAATLTFNWKSVILPVPAIGDNMSQSASKKARKFAQAVHAALLGMGLAAGSATLTLPEGNQVELLVKATPRPGRLSTDPNPLYAIEAVNTVFTPQAAIMTAVLGRNYDVYDSISYIRKSHTHGNGDAYTRPA